MNRELVKYLQLCPSGDNCQPFKYQVGENKLNIRHQSEIGKHVFNQNNTASLIALGFQLEVAGLYASSKGMDLIIDFSALEGKDFEVELSFNHAKDPSKEAQAKLNLLSMRYTDRRPYLKSKGPILSKETKGNSFNIKEKFSHNFVKLLSKADFYMFEDRQAFNDIEQYTRYSKSAVEKTKTGFSYKNLMMDPITALLFRLYSFDSILNIFIKRYFKFLNFLKINFFYKSSAGFACFFLDEDEESREDIVKLGGKILNFWLLLTEQGFVAQPISSVSLLPFSQKHMGAKFSNGFTPHFEKVYSCLQDEFNLGSKKPLWVMRYGKVKKPLPLKSKTVRKQVDDVIAA